MQQNVTRECSARSAGERHKTVLIVDHDCAHATSLASVLNGAGFVVFLFSSAEDLLRRLPVHASGKPQPTMPRSNDSRPGRVAVRVQIVRKQSAAESDDRRSFNSRLSVTAFRVEMPRVSFSSANGHAVWNSPCCVLCEVRLPGIDGRELRQQFAARSIMTPFVFYTESPPTRMVVQAIKTGVADFLERPCRPEEVLSAVNSAVALPTVSSSTDALQRFASQLPRLSPRERNVLLLIAQGMHYKQIAAELHVSPNTVRAQRTNIMEKLEIPSSADLQRLATLLAARSPGSVPLPPN